MMAIGACASLWAETAVEARLKKLNETIIKLEKDLAKRRDASADNSANIRENERRLSQIDRELANLAKQLGQQNQSLEKLREQQRALRAQQTTLLNLARSQLVNRYIYSKPTWMQLLSIRDISQINDEVVYQTTIQSASAEQLKAQSKGLRTLAENQQRIDAQAQSLKARQQAHKITSQKLAAINARRTKEAEALARQIGKTNNAIAENRAALKALEQALKNSRKKHRHRGEPVKKGRLISPLAVKTLHEYGERRNPTRMTWQGQVYPAKPQSSIRAAGRGTVIFAEYLKGYGNLVILDHGNSVLSLYAYTENILASVGGRVEQNELIARTGFVDPINKHGLYFEIRHRGKAVDPKQWLGRF